MIDVHTHRVFWTIHKYAGLLACAWLADPAGSQATIADLSRRLYGMAPARPVMPQWLP